MSKSRKNVVDPAEIIVTYGADTARLYMLSDSPPARDLEWTEAGIEGAWCYLNRLWRMVVEPAAELAPAAAPRPELGHAPPALLPDLPKQTGNAVFSVYGFHLLVISV